MKAALGRLFLACDSEAPRENTALVLCNNDMPRIAASVKIRRWKTVPWRQR
jgi:hypothetical protein